MFVAVLTAALILTAGLVVDGGQKVAASSRAEGAAAGAARAAGNAAATQGLAGSDNAGSAALAAKAFLRSQPGVTGTVSVTAGLVKVETRSSATTIFLSVIGIDSVTASGSAEANVVATGHSR